MLELATQAFWATVVWLIMLATAYPLWKRLTVLGRMALAIFICAIEAWVITQL